MRGSAILLVALAALAACKREPTFDERYQAAQAKIHASAAAIDAELEANAAAEAPAGPTPSSDNEHPGP
jgi:hypothetical protein